MTIVNAFHKDFIKTHMPNFLHEFRTYDGRRQAAEELSRFVTITRKTKPSHGQVVGISKAQRETVPNQKFKDIGGFPKTRESMKSLRQGSKMTIAAVAEELKPREFRYYAKAGNPAPAKKKRQA